MFIEELVTFGIKVETTPGTAVSLAQANYNIRGTKPVYDHTTAEFKRKYATGNFSWDSSIMGKQEASFSTSVYIAEGAVLNSNEAVITALNSCGILDTVNGATGVNYTPYTPYNNKTCTIEVVEKNEGASPTMLLMTFAGCTGDAKMVLDTVGEPVRWDLEFKGKLSSIADRAFGSIIAPAFGTTTPTRVLSATITKGAVVQQLEGFTLEFKNNLQPIGKPADATGIGYFYIAGREPHITVNPLVNTLAADPAYTEWLAHTTGLLTITWGNFSLTVPKAQYVALKPGTRNGARIYEKTFRCVKNSDAGDNEFNLLQGV